MGSILRVKIPRKASDDMIMETIGGDPALRRELEEMRLQQMKRNGCSEMDIVEEGVDVYLKLAHEITKGAWPRVVNNAVVSGEFRRTVVGLTSFWKGLEPPRGENQSLPTPGSDNPAQSAISAAPPPGDGLLP